jgi:hypothetical protein
MQLRSRRTLRQRNEETRLEVLESGSAESALWLLAEQRIGFQTQSVPVNASAFVASSLAPGRSRQLKSIAARSPRSV